MKKKKILIPINDNQLLAFFQFQKKKMKKYYNTIINHYKFLTGSVSRFFLKNNDGKRKSKCFSLLNLFVYL